MKHQSLMTLVALSCILPCFTIQADTCSDILDALNKSRSLSELRSNAQRLNIKDNETRQCESVLKNNTKVRQLLNSEKQRNAGKLRAHLAAVRRNVKSADQLAINNRAAQLRSQAKNKLSQLQRASAQVTLQKVPTKKPAAGSTNGTPTQARITGVTPSTIVPGLDIVIEGSNFGRNSGTVQLKLQGKTFNATINSWNDTWINAYLSDSVGGVLPSDNAVISVQVPQQGAVNHNTPFIPIYVQESASEEYGSDGNPIFPDSGTATVFKGKSLNRGWQVAEYSVTNEPTFGNCELGTPSMSVGDDRLESQLKWSYDWWEGFAWCYIDVYAEGPQGIASGL